MINLAKLFGGRIEAEKEDFLPNTLIGYGLKYLILEDRINFEKYVTYLESNKTKRGMKQISEGYYKAYKGIMDKNEEIFNEGLTYLLKNHRANMKKNANTIEMYFAYDSIALSILARSQGLEITVKHKLLPIEFLEDSLIDYSDITLFN
ncbi:MAG: Imm49 family immunity protein [Clostridiaceae bacterium]|nr:Imm49 family immunity protein [Clostridiaceae bacterium]